jgi:hypothetical protein
MSSESAGAGLAGVVFGIIGLAVVVVMIASMWKVFVKAGQPGWAAFVPIYNVLMLLKITGKPTWWFALFLVPGVNLIIMALVTIQLAKTFGKSAGFGLGMLLLGFIFYPILAFGDAHYTPATA